MYTTPKEGTYSHKMPNFDGTFSVQQVKVAVLGESEKQYLIRLILPVGNAGRDAKGYFVQPVYTVKETDCISRRSFARKEFDL